MKNETLELFYEKNSIIKPKFIDFPNFQTEFNRYQWLQNESGVPYWEIPMDGLPYKEMLSEAQELKSLFVDHRANDPSQMGASHNGWASLTIHGISSQHTMNWDSYDEYKSLGDEKLVPYDWTEISDRIPKTIEYFKDVFPHESYTRVRFMLLKAGGYVLPHRDRDHKLLFPINIALNNPEGCNFIMENQGIVPFKEGKGFLLDLSNRHAVWNDSKEDRIHLIVHWRNAQYHEPAGKKWAEMVTRNYKPTPKFI